MFSMFRNLLALVAASLLPLSVQAADMPKAGSDNFTTVLVVTLANTIQQGTQSFVTYEVDGVARNDAGGPMFNFFGVRCIALEEGPDPSKFTGHGTCTFTDADGDNIFTPYNSTGGRGGTFEVAGGTGKFAGITGNGEWRRIDLAPIKSDDKRARAVVSNKVSWKLP
jgi:hypothetical protein